MTTTFPTSPAELTTPTPTQVRKRLTDDEVRTCKRRLVETDPSQFVVAVWEQLMGKDAWEAASQIDPKSYAIPEDQWKELCNWISHHTPISLRVTACLMWVNVGPSAYVE